MGSRAASDASAGVAPSDGGASPGVPAASPAPAGASPAPGAGDDRGVYVRPTVAGAAKILVVGPLGVGKTTLIGSVSEIRPLSTEAVMTQAGARVDTGGERSKRTTTVALDFGRITLDGELVLYLFGTPGQPRFLPTWRELANGCLGALALVDTRDLEASFDSLGHLEDLDVPFSVAVNSFPDSPRYGEAELRAALDLLPHTPLTVCDARDHDSSLRALIALVTHLIETTGETPS
ncbi:ATP/GTP-binding protein [Streptomyces desertarenae]|uniref:ATP/GTP-binding protein n=1 Tax=Streptomyces desertarenae TaxID=2666184 RepID=A0ABW4PD33_9ACTN